MSDDTPELYCRHLLVCRTIWYTPEKPDEEYSLGRLVVTLRPPAGSGGRYVETRLFAYVQLFGEVGDYDARVQLVRVFEDGEEELAVWGPWLSPVTGFDLVDCHAFALPGVPFDGPGLYEFQLYLDGGDEPLAAERVMVPPTEDVP